MEIAFKNTYSQENGYKQMKPLKTRKTVEIQEISSWLYLGIILYFNWVKIQLEFLGVLPDNSNNKTHIVLIIRPPPHSIHIYKNKIVYYRANNSMSSIFRSSCVFTSRCFLAGLSENRTYNFAMLFMRFLSTFEMTFFFVIYLPMFLIGIEPLDAFPGVRDLSKLHWK